MFTLVILVPLHADIIYFIHIVHICGTIYVTNFIIRNSKTVKLLQGGNER